MTNEYIILKKSGIHGKGVFAKTDIKKGTKIIEYVGEKITKAEGDRRAEKVFARSQKDKNKGAVYLFELNKQYDIDGDVDYNPAKYINHSCDPNCEADISRGHIWIQTIKNIKKGDEITYNYGYAYDTDFEEHHCRCGSKNCIGYILAKDDWKKIKNKKK